MHRNHFYLSFSIIFIASLFRGLLTADEVKHVEKAVSTEEFAKYMYSVSIFPFFTS